jgi:2-polyprenyl-3-methyl-5-hydroxy-6-metoxy-1,4-benzoquinol methylase
MNKKNIKIACQSLSWEARYRKGEHLTGTRAFLPELNILDKDFAETLNLFGVMNGKLLDIGTGLGIQAIRYAQLGFNVTATDVSPTAVEMARKNLLEEGVNAYFLRFVVDNILMSKLKGPYDLIIDRGCYTLLGRSMHEDYCKNVYRLLNQNGLFLLKMDAKKNKAINSLETHFSIMESKTTHYHGEIRKGPMASYFILKPIYS